MNGSGQHSSLLQYGNNYCLKKFYSTGPHESMFQPFFCITDAAVAKKLFFVLGKFSKVGPGNTNWRERLSTVDLLDKVACFVTKVINIFDIKTSWFKLDGTE